MKNKTLVSFSTHNAPFFLQHLVESIERFDAGADFDLLILDQQNDDPQALRLLEKYAKRYSVFRRPNTGRAQGGYNWAASVENDYATYFFMHDDSSVIQDGWLARGLQRLNDRSLEEPLRHLPHAADLARMPIGKVGYQAYGWGTLSEYLSPRHPAIFRYMQPIADIMQENVPTYFQHTNDDRILLTNACIRAKPLPKIWNIEFFKNYVLNKFESIDDFFRQNFPGRGFIEPKNLYHGADWEGFQTTCEFLNDIMPMQNGFRTHALIGDGVCQEKVGWSYFWGNEYVAHFGSHNVFKRLALLLACPEETVRKRYADPTFLKICARIIRDEVLRG